MNGGDKPAVRARTAMRIFGGMALLAGTVLARAEEAPALPVLPAAAPYAPGPSDQALDRWPLAAATPAQVADGIAAATGYLLANQHARGQFAYIRFMPEYGREPSLFAPVAAPPGKYNMLRHGGTVYALTLAHERLGAAPSAVLPPAPADAASLPPSPGASAVKEAAVKAARYLHAFIRPLPKAHRDALALWSPPDEDLDDDGGRGRAKLGGAGLALVGLCAVERFAPATTPLATLRGLGLGVLAMQRPNGSFYSVMDERGEPEAFVSLYYPGEAMLGLAYLSDVDPADGRWLLAAAHGMAHLARSRADTLVVPADHWALLATRALLARYERILRLDDGRAAAAGRAELRAHAAQIAENMLAEQILAPAQPARHGCFRSDGTLCPVAIRVEGLLAALDVLAPENAPPLPDPSRPPPMLSEPGGGGRVADQEDAAVAARYAELAGRIRAALPPAVSFLLRHQARAGELRGGFPRASRTLDWPLVPPPPVSPEARERYFAEARAVRAFNRRVWEVRVDYVQHALCALIDYERRLDGK